MRCESFIINAKYVPKNREKLTSFESSISKFLCFYVDLLLKGALINGYMTAIIVISL